MWGSNGIWNLALLAIGIWLAILSFTTFRSTEVVLDNIAWEDSRLAQEKQNFGTASFEWEMLEYVNKDWNKTLYSGKGEIEDFCIDILGE